MDKSYGTNKIIYIRLLYIIGIILWIAFVVGLGLLQSDDIFVILIIILPIAIFLFNMYTVRFITTGMEETLYKINYISIGLVIILPLITWFNNDMNKNNGISRKKFMTIVITALILTLLSLIDVWVSLKYLSVLKHVKAILQTLSLSLIIYALYTYYIEHICSNVDGTCS